MVGGFSVGFGCFFVSFGWSSLFRIQLPGRVIGRAREGARAHPPIPKSGLYVPAPIRPSEKSDPSRPRSSDHSILRLFSNTGLWLSLSSLDMKRICFDPNCSWAKLAFHRGYLSAICIWARRIRTVHYSHNICWFSALEIITPLRIKREPLSI